MSLKVKAIRSAFWFALATATNNLLFFLVTLVLARLLNPSDFGLVAIANLIVYALSIFQNIGLSQALIYKGDNLKNTADTAFILAISFGIGAFSLASLSAPLITTLFKEPRANLLTQFFAFSLLISSFGVVPESILIAQLDFKRKFTADVIPSTGYAALAIGLAVLGFGAWSIIIGRLTESLIRVVLIWFLTKWRPRFQFKWSVAKELLTYGKNIAISSILAILFLNIDNVFVSRILGTTQLGYYTFAFSLATMPVLFAQRVIDTVSFPTYSQIKENRDTLTTAYLKSLRVIATFVLPTNLGLLAVAPVLVPVFYGDKWFPSIILVQILSLYGLIRAIANPPTNVLLAIGKQHLFPRFASLYLILAALVLGPSIYLQGSIGVAMAMTLIIGLMGITWFWLADYHLNISFKQTFQVIAPQSLAALFMLIIVMSTGHFLNKSLYTLLLLISIGFVTFFATLLMITRGKTISEMQEIIQPILFRENRQI